MPPRGATAKCSDRSAKPTRKSSMQEVFACGEAGFGEFGSEMEGSRANISPAENLAVQIMEKELQASDAQGKKEDALRLLKEATTIENSMTFEFGQPLPVKPSHEMYADFFWKLANIKKRKPNSIELLLARLDGV
jgi:hypothetical protein